MPFLVDNITNNYVPRSSVDQKIYISLKVIKSVYISQ